MKDCWSWDSHTFEQIASTDDQHFNGQFFRIKNCISYVQGGLERFNDTVIAFAGETAGFVDIILNSSVILA